MRETGKSIAEVVRDLDLNPGTLGSWAKKDLIERGEAEGLTFDGRGELHQLRKDVAALRMERDVLERSVVLWVIPDLVERDFSAEAINVKWCGDLTEIPTDEGKLFLATVEDLASRRLPSFAIGEYHDAELASGALKTAVAIRGGNVRGVVFHSDKGGEYTGDLFAEACDAVGVTQSMGWVGSASDNAAAESFNSTLEWELFSRRHFTTKDQARRAVSAFIDRYNRLRPHSSCEMRSPVDYEQLLAARAVEQASAA